MRSQVQDHSIDLTITSPPYDNLRDYQGYSFNFQELAKELYRVTKKGGVMVWVTGDQVINRSESGTSAKQKLYFKEIGFNIHDTMIYQKNGSPYPEKTRYYQVFEYMIVFSKGKPETVHLIKDMKVIWKGSWGNHSECLKDGKLKKKDRPISYNVFRPRDNIWKYEVGKEYSTKDEIAYQHPAIFPEALARDHIKSWSDPNDVILDPMSGSGTTPKMAEQLRRR